MKKIFTKISALIAALIISVSMVGCSLFEGSEFIPELPDSAAAGSSYGLNVNDSTNRVADRVAAIAKVERSIVAIKMDYATTSGGTGTSSGSGVIVDNLDPNDNIFYILTCFHVIDSKGDITVYVPDMNTRNFTDDDYDERFTFTGTIANTIKNDEVTLIGGDKFSDVAVLKLNLANTGVANNEIVSAKLPGENYEMKRGESVFAIGNPSGELPMNVSDGIISYLDRKANINGVGEMLLTQIDVQINHGSSGGGLFNYYGELVGITNAGSETYDGINYAIPYETTYIKNGGFEYIATQLIGTHFNTFNQKNFGYVSGSWEVGVTITSLSQSNTTPIVASVVEGSNADGKLKVNDVLKGLSCSKLSYKQSFNSVDGFANALAYLRTHLRLGDSFAIEIYRGNTQMTITIDLTEQMIFCDTGYRTK
ncbi:MAG: trypsin-like serine protease [Clostridiales bacterium]|nr:trypsin-like serine protease [Clostridiales bacterium]